MSIRTVGDPVRNEPGLVDKFIGTDFDIVHAVAKQLDDIKTVASNLNNVSNLSAQITVLQSMLSAFEDSIADWKTLSMLGDNIYPDTETGLSEVPYNGYFVVVAPVNVVNDLGYIYLNNDGIATLIKTIPSSAYNDSLTARLNLFENNMKLLGLYDVQGTMDVLQSLPTEDTKNPKTFWNNQGVMTQGSDDGTTPPDPNALWNNDGIATKGGQPIS